MGLLLEVGSEMLLRIWKHPNGEDTVMVEELLHRREQNLVREEAGSGGMAGEGLTRIEPRPVHWWQEPSIKENEDTDYMPCYFFCI